MCRKIVLILVASLFLGVSANAKVLQKDNVNKAIALSNGQYIIQDSNNIIYFNENKFLEHGNNISLENNIVTIDESNYTINESRLLEIEKNEDKEKEINTSNGNILIDGRLVYASTGNSLIANCKLLYHDSEHYIVFANIDSKDILFDIDSNLISKINCDNVAISNYKLTKKMYGFNLFSNTLSIVELDKTNSKMKEVTINNILDASIDSNGDLWYLLDNKVYKYVNGVPEEKYIVPITASRISAYDDNNIIAWNTDRREFWISNDKSNSIDSGWSGKDGKWQYYKNYLPLVNDWLNYKDNWYHFDGNGYMSTGWFQDNDKWYYASNGGYLIKGTQIDGIKYVWNGYALFNGWIGEDFYKDGVKQ